MEDSKIAFIGPGPFSIGTAQSASAQALGSSVQITVWAVVGEDPTPRPINMQISRKNANALSSALLKAAIQVKTGS